MSSSRDKSDTSSYLNGSSYSKATPMAIRFASEAVPPPLPPPKFLPELCDGLLGPTWDAERKEREARPLEKEHDLGQSPARKLSVDTSQQRNSPPARAQRRQSSLTTLLAGQEQEMLVSVDTQSDENESENYRMPPPYAELKGEQELRQRNVDLSSQTYDKLLLSRIGGPNTSRLQSLPFNSTVLLENGRVWSKGLEQQNSSLHTPFPGELRTSSYDSVSIIKWPTASAIWSDRGAVETDRASASRHSSVTSVDTGSHRGSYDHSIFASDDFYAEEGRIRNLCIDDRSPRSPKAGSKRRASSPAQEREDRSSVSSASGQNESLHRRSMQNLLNRNSPISKFHADQLSLSSASSVAPRHGSLGSSVGMTSAPSSATSYTSNGLSPSFASLPFDLDRRKESQLGDAVSADRSPVTTKHQRALSESGPSVTRKLSTDTAPSRKSSLPQLQVMHVCECCPKKPRKFDTEFELRQHENEKQYSCAYCSNRFKNKNEAERHQNSLHLRHHSWSCAALSGIEAAFHSSTSTNDSDTCGYCGHEFPNPPQWDARAEHLQHVHKFGECNQAKKFFRADHFRQHLKHSHQGASGKWTNILENACMKDEPLPEKRMSPIAISVPPGQPFTAPMSNGLSASRRSRNDTIEETPHDS